MSHSNFTTPYEALMYTVRFAMELQQEGIPMTTDTPIFKEDPETRRRNSGPDHVAPEYWTKILFTPKTPEDRRKVHAKKDELYVQGLRFDVGMSGTSMVWHLDWSFRMLQEEPAT